MNRLALVASVASAVALVSSAAAADRPYRVAVVIGDQWKDPSSQLVRRPETSEPADFFHVAVMLKSWALPFDVIRLDQQLLDERMFISADDRPKYGAILWLVPADAKLWHPD